MSKDNEFRGFISRDAYYLFNSLDVDVWYSFDDYPSHLMLELLKGNYLTEKYYLGNRMFLVKQYNVINRNSL